MSKLRRVMLLYFLSVVRVSERKYKVASLTLTRDYFFCGHVAVVVPFLVYSLNGQLYDLVVKL